MNKTPCRCPGSPSPPANASEIYSQSQRAQAAQRRVSFVCSVPSVVDYFLLLLNRVDSLLSALLDVVARVLGALFRILGCSLGSVTGLVGGLFSPFRRVFRCGLGSIAGLVGSLFRSLGSILRRRLRRGTRLRRCLPAAF